MPLLRSSNDMTLVHWYRNGAELSRHYSSEWFLLPIGSIFITLLVILLMVIFNRCPQMIAGIVTGLLGLIIILIVLISLDHKPVYN